MKLHSTTFFLRFFYIFFIVNFMRGNLEAWRHWISVKRLLILPHENDSTLIYFCCAWGRGKVNKSSVFIKIDFLAGKPIQSKVYRLKEQTRFWELNASLPVICKYFSFSTNHFLYDWKYLLSNLRMSGVCQIKEGAYHFVSLCGMWLYFSLGCLRSPDNHDKSWFFIKKYQKVQIFKDEFFFFKIYFTFTKKNWWLFLLVFVDPIIYYTPSSSSFSQWSQEKSFDKVLTLHFCFSLDTLFIGAYSLEHSQVNVRQTERAQQQKHVYCHKWKMFDKTSVCCKFT